MARGTVARYRHMKAFTRLAFSLRRFFGDRVTLQQAEDAIKSRLNTREERLIESMRTEVYGRPDSPYLKLLQLAGCEFSDVQASVRRYGVEESLTRLANEGVYLTAEEFKGKREVARHGRSFHVGLPDFDRADAPAGFIGHSSGTTNAPTHTERPLDWLITRTYATAIFFAAHDALSHSHAVYDSILPGTAINHIMINAKLGKATDRWFARKVPFKSRGSSLRCYATTCMIALAGKYFGPGFPLPESVDLPDIHRIVRWAALQKRLKKNAFITTVASSAARVARVAWEMGETLEGVKFYVAGEPFTEAKEEIIRRVGATATSRFSYGGGISVGYGCARPSKRDEVHVNQHVLAVVRRAESVASSAAIHPLLLTTLDPTAPRFHLNVESGDYATLSTRDCGCALERVGLKLHLHDIGSYEKFTSEGMNYFYGDLFKLVEKILPAEFGGGPGDYQLVEAEDEAGQTRITLRVHSRVGALDEQRILSRLRQEMSTGSWRQEFQTKLWQRAGTLRVSREVPYASARGKILPLHLARR